MKTPKFISPQPWLGDGNSVRIVSNEKHKLGRVDLEDSDLYKWFFENAERIDILGISCSKFVDLLTKDVEIAEKNQGGTNTFLKQLIGKSYIFRNILKRSLTVKIWFLSPDSDYVKLRRVEGDDRCRNNILRSIGRLRCLERELDRAINLKLGLGLLSEMKGGLEVNLVSKNPCFSVFRAAISGEETVQPTQSCGGSDRTHRVNANPSQPLKSAYSGTIMGIIGQAQEVKSFPAIWIPAHNGVTSHQISTHLANLCTPSKPNEVSMKLFELDKKRCRFNDWTKRWDAFVSYNHRDKDIVEDLHHRLDALGIRCFHDERGGNSMPGRDWEKNIQEALQQTNCAIVCVGEKGLGEWQEKRELVYLDAYKRNDVTVIPVSLCQGNKCPALPGYLDKIYSRNAFQYDPTKDFESSVGKLAEAIHEANRC